MHFTKMQGLGNDYLYIFGEVPGNVKELSVKLSDRHFGVGSDGLIYISRSETADFRMRIFNADGSEAMMCGNGIRCVGKYVYEKGYTEKEEITVETLSGIRTLLLDIRDGKVNSVSVDMGYVRHEKDMTVKMYDTEYRMAVMNIGNPHAVIFTDDLSEETVRKIGPRIEHHTRFPGGINVEFVSVTGENTLRMRVWERGSGVTMACGTGACASAGAAAVKGLVRQGEPVIVRLDGGELQITVHEDGKVTMKGPAEFVCEGDVPDDDE